MAHTIIVDTGIMGVHATLEAAYAEAQQIQSARIRIVTLYPPGLGTQKPIGYLLVPEGYRCCCCGNHVDKLGGVAADMAA